MTQLRVSLAEKRVLVLDRDFTLANDSIITAMKRGLHEGGWRRTCSSFPTDTTNLGSPQAGASRIAAIYPPLVSTRSTVAD
ncbi:hypothetical protein PG993_002367 [Apiospora rasikravindrae]|uniref:Uncharacterized protein n=1 Tax=Apiospora rasikravindrae TaxID=990691 RepID=A0ABR1TWM3_9PEZI